MLVGTWWYADLLPPEPTAAAMIEAIVAWKADKRPREQVLEVIAAVGPACLPHIDRALALPTKPAHHALLVAARKRLASMAKG